MKQKIVTTLVLGAIAAMSATSAMAGQITASSTNIAREVIVNDTQPVNSPVISYRFAGDVDATVQAQEFQVQFTLEGAKWNTAAAPSADAFSITPTAGTDAGVPGLGGTDFAVGNIGFSADGYTLWATITVPVVPAGAWVDSLLDQPIITLNGGGTTTAATILALKTLVGDIVNDYNTRGVCADNKSLFVNFQHFKLLSNPAAIAVEGSNGVGDEHLRAAATNRAGIINFPTNLLVAIGTSGGNAKVDVSAANLAFVGTTAVGLTSFVSTTIANLGQVDVNQNAFGYDIDLATQYLVNTPAIYAAAATLTTGTPEIEKIDVTVTAPNGFVNGGTLWLDSGIKCATATLSNAGVATAITAANAAGPITLSVNTAGTVNAAIAAINAGTNLNVCYGVAGVVNPIPLSSFSAVATVDKSGDYTDNQAEQNNVCNGTLYSLGGGVKIDVRNYADATTHAATGWQSVIRLINNNESRTIDVYGQYIYADGSYGRWGKLTDLAPRAAMNLNAAQVDALLTSAPAAAGSPNTAGTPDFSGAAYNSGTAASRLRVTSNAGSSLRVQNYLFQDGSTNFVEASSSQAVDFEGTIDRAPVSEGQYQSQDAQAGINRN